MRHAGLATAPLPPGPPGPLPDPGYVLVLDEPAPRARRNDILELLFLAREDHPGKRLLVLSSADGGQVRDGDLDGTATRIEGATPLPVLLDGARAVYTVAAPAGFDAIMAGHRPVVTGDPAYAGRGLTDDRGPLTRGRRPLTRAQLFALTMIDGVLWYDPHRDALCGIEEAISAEAARFRAAREDARGYVAAGFRLWKRAHLARMLGGQVRFVKRADRGTDLAARLGRPLLLWGSAEAHGAVPEPLRAEDGFLRSRGLGARLVPPLSLAVDDLGIYYDPGRESRLERLIAQAPGLPSAEIARAEALLARIRALGLTKYNIPGGTEEIPKGAILVPGQVEDDASVLKGAGEMRTNLDLLKAVRAANPGAVLLYKPHPDVEAGLRRGRVEPAEVLALADRIVTGDPARLLVPGISVWTITSLLGFEALIRGLPVTTLGAPFYAGWGLTQDLGPVPARRSARPGLAGLAHAALIGYPRYLDPRTGLPCPPEVALERLAAGEGLPPRVFSRGSRGSARRFCPGRPPQSARQRCRMSPPTGSTETRRKRRASASRSSPSAAIPGRPSAPMASPAEKTASSSTSPADRSDPARLPPPSQNTRVRPSSPSAERPAGSSPAALPCGTAQETRAEARPCGRVLGRDRRGVMQEPERRFRDRPDQRAVPRQVEPARGDEAERLADAPISRTVSAGSSARAVPPPTSTASCARRIAWTRRRASGPVIQRLSPVAVAMRPSSVRASFSVSQGRPRSMRDRKPALAARASAARTPVVTTIPWFSRSCDPLRTRADRGPGERSRHAPRPPRPAPRRRAASGRDARRVPARHRPWRPAPPRPPARAPRSRHGASRPVASSRGRGPGRP
jgi:capsular polysaccharide export protein